MARNFLVAINLNKNELQNAQVQNLAGAPSSPVKGQLYMNSTDNNLYWWDGSNWVSARGGLQFGSVTQEQTFGTAKSDGVAATAARSDHAHGNPAHDNAAHSAITLSALAAPTTDVSWGNYKITNLGSPAATTDAANKAYVDSAVAGLSWKAPVEVATTGNIALSGTQTIDGVVVAVGNSVLVKSQSNQTENGIYTVASGAWTRRTDIDTPAEFPNASVFVMSGVVNQDTAWTCTNPTGVVIGTTNITWVQFAGTGAVTGGSGMTQSGNTLNVVAANGSIVVGADDIQVGYAGTGGNNGSAATAARSDHLHTGLYTRSAAANCAAAATTTVTHNFGHRNVRAEVYRNSTPWDTVDTDVERPDINSVTVRFATTPAAAEYTIVVFG
jgi:hypothetical protein